MKISIITPTWNSAATIRRNLDSVHTQADVEIEHIIVDNLSSDETLSIIRQSPFNVTLISEKDKGISDAFNKGIRKSTGDIIAILNSDDCFYSPDTLKLVSNEFERTSADIVHGDLLFVDPEFGTNIRKPLLCPIEVAFPFNHPSFFVRKNIYDRIGLFDETFRLAMDFEFVSRFYRSPSDTDLKISYISSKPLTTMYAGGASWAHEIKTLHECQQALKLRGRWNARARRSFLVRKLRTLLKQKLQSCGITAPVILWRKMKWR